MIPSVRPSRPTGAGRASPNSRPWPRRWSRNSTRRTRVRPPLDAALPIGAPTVALRAPWPRLSWRVSSRRTSRFSWSVDETALARAELFDGKLALITNAPDLTRAETVSRYKALADIERGFRVLKSDIEIAPVHHRLPDRIRAHALICFLALVLYRVMRMRLKAKGHAASPRTA